MTTASLIAPAETTTATAKITCPPWCIVPMAEHDKEADQGTFHRSVPSDIWMLDYDEHVVRVAPEVFVDQDGSARQELVIIEGDLSRGSVDLAELTIPDARRLSAALLEASLATECASSPRPDPGDVDMLRHLLDLMADFSSNDQRARYLLSSNWLRDHGALAGARVRSAAKLIVGRAEVAR